MARMETLTTYDYSNKSFLFNLLDIGCIPGLALFGGKKVNVLTGRSSSYPNTFVQVAVKITVLAAFIFAVTYADTIYLVPNLVMIACAIILPLLVRNVFRSLFKEAIKIENARRKQEDLRKATYFDQRAAQERADREAQENRIAEEQRTAQAQREALARREAQVRKLAEEQRLASQPRPVPESYPFAKNDDSSVEKNYSVTEEEITSAFQLLENVRDNIKVLSDRTLYGDQKSLKMLIQLLRIPKWKELFFEDLVDEAIETAEKTLPRYSRMGGIPILSYGPKSDFEKKEDRWMDPKGVEAIVQVLHAIAAPGVLIR